MTAWKWSVTRSSKVCGQLFTRMTEQLKVKRLTTTGAEFTGIGAAASSQIACEVMLSLRKI